MVHHDSNSKKDNIMKTVADYRKEIKKLKAEHKAAFAKMYNQYVQMQKDNASENKFKIANLQLQVDKLKERNNTLASDLSIIKHNEEKLSESNTHKDATIRGLNRDIGRVVYDKDVLLQTLKFITK